MTPAQMQKIADWLGPRYATQDGEIFVRTEFHGILDVRVKLKSLSDGDLMLAVLERLSKSKWSNFIFARYSTGCYVIFGAYEGNGPTPLAAALNAVLAMLEAKP